MTATAGATGVRTTGIGAYAAYLPAFALASTTFGEAGPAEPRRARSVACHDEDSLTMAVEAARRLGDSFSMSSSVIFATTEPPYLDKSSSSTLHAALGVRADAAALDVTGLRAAGGALRMALLSGGSVVFGDLRTPAAGGADELSHGDAGVAFTATDDPQAAALLLASASTTFELLDRWRTPGDVHTRVWDERFTGGVLLEAAVGAAARALSEAGVPRADHVVVSCANSRSAVQIRTALGGNGSDGALQAVTGHTGAAHLGLLLADALDRASPGDVILAVCAADGADALVFRAGDGVHQANRGPRVRAQLHGRTVLSYDRYLRWRGLLNLTGARRPEPAAPSSPPMLRTSEWKYALVGSRCTRCGLVAAPPARVCPGCGAVDASEPAPLRDRACTVVSHTTDHLTPSPDGTVVVAVVDIDGGGRRSSYVTDAPEREIAVGDTLRPTFRRLSASDGILNYFWKLRPGSEI